jgi:hypothetical protein
VEHDAREGEEIDKPDKHGFMIEDLVGIVKIKIQNCEVLD